VRAFRWIFLLYQTSNRSSIDITVIYTLLQVLNVKICACLIDMPHNPQHAHAPLHMQASFSDSSIDCTLFASTCPSHRATPTSKRNLTTQYSHEFPQDDLQSHARNIFSALPHPHLLSNLHSSRLLCRLVRALQSHLAHLRAARDRREQTRQNHLLQSRRRRSARDCWQLWRFCVRFEHLARPVGLYLMFLD
jgi:hypothetical protein